MATRGKSDKIVLLGKPKSTNNIYKYRIQGNWIQSYMSPEGRQLKKDYIWQIKEQWKKKPLKRDLKLSIDIFHYDRRKRDIDNYNKLVLDAMEGLVYENDHQIIELCIRKYYDKENPRILVIVN